MRSLRYPMVIPHGMFYLSQLELTSTVSQVRGDGRRAVYWFLACYVAQYVSREQ